MAFSAGSFIISYNPGDRILNLKDVNNNKIGGFNVCHYQKGITEGKELWITTPEVILVLDFATDVEAKQALNILETTIESLAPNCPTGGGGGSIGPGTLNRVTKWLSSTTIGDGSWAFNGNTIFPVTDGSDIGLTGTNRVGTIYLASTLNYADHLVFSEAGTERGRFKNGKLGINISVPTSILEVVGTDNSSANYAFKVDKTNIAATASASRTVNVGYAPNPGSWTITIFCNQNIALTVAPVTPGNSGTPAANTLLIFIPSNSTASQIATLIRNAFNTYTILPASASGSTFTINAPTAGNIGNTFAIFINDSAEPANPPNQPAYTNGPTVFTGGADAGPALVFATRNDGLTSIFGTFQYADGSEGAGKVLTSNGTGIATWVTPTPPPSITYATLPETEAGTEATHVMTPKTVRQAVQSNNGWLDFVGVVTSPGNYSATCFSPAGLDAFTVGPLYNVNFQADSIGNDTVTFITNTGPVGPYPIKTGQIGFAQPVLAGELKVNVAYSGIFDGASFIITGELNVLTRNENKNIYVDPVWGNDSNGKKYSRFFPFKSTQIAEAQAADGDVIVFLPGVHNLAQTLVLGLPIGLTTITYNAMPGAFINNSIGNLFLANNDSPTNIYILGKGIYNTDSICFLNKPTTAINVVFECMSLTATNGDFFVNNGGTFSVTAEEDFIALGNTAFLLQDSIDVGIKMKVKARSIKTTRHAFITVCSATQNSELTIEGDINILTSAFTSNGAISGYNLTGGAGFIINHRGNIYREDNVAQTNPLFEFSGSQTMICNVYGDIYDLSTTAATIGTINGASGNQYGGNLKIHGDINSVWGINIIDTPSAPFNNYTITLNGKLITSKDNTPSISAHGTETTCFLEINNEVVNTNTLNPSYNIYLDSAIGDTPTVKLSQTTKLRTDPTKENIFATAAKNIKTYPGASGNTGINVNITELIATLVIDANV